MEKLRCVAERITYYNEENGYAVLKCRVQGYSDLVTVVGLMPEVHVGSVLSLGGTWKNDAKYGKQFVAETFEETLPATVYGIEKYLGSGLVKGIGPKYAKRIVKFFGAETLNIIDNTPDELLNVPGIGEARVNQIKKSWTEQREVKNIMVFLQSHNVSSSHATKIYKTYGNDSIQVVQENPYRLADDIWGIGFRTADTIAAKMGFGHEKYERIRSGIVYTLNKLSDEGHCYATQNMLAGSGAELLDVSEETILETMEKMISAGELKTEIKDDETVVYLPPFYFAEYGTARRLREIFSADSSVKAQINGLSEKIAASTGMAYDETQMEAITASVRNKILILTGGPGTGKTTTTLGIINALKLCGASILLAAPTGRAAKRMSEATGMEAKTIHRLLEVKPPEGFQRNENNKLQGDALIVDECSMIDIMLMYHLLKAVPDSMVLIFVGDTDQLPSVGAGNVLRDMINSDFFPVVKLTKIFRQAQTSRIIMNAHRINKGQMPDISNGKNTDFFFIECEEPEQAANEIVSLVSRRLSSHYNIPAREIQVLTPMQRGPVGAARLNEILQNAVNPGTLCLRRGGVQYRVNDKVMQIRNNYDKEVFNGDIGTVESVSTEDNELAVNFEGRTVIYDSSELEELVLAYATTVHKSQGSEYPVVVMPVMTTHYVMLQRNLVYTGITRAKKIMVIVGTQKALAMAVRNMNVLKRNTMLAERINTPVRTEVKDKWPEL